VKTVRPDKPAIRVPPIVHTVRQHAKRQLGEWLQTLFDNTDDALFELADRSVSNSEQTLFFESMRQIRLRRKEVCDRFVRALNRGFDELFDGISEPAVSSLDAAGDELSLLANDDLEITVAIAGIVSKVSSSHSLQLLQLTKRVDHVCRAQTVTERSNPLGPHKLSSAFVEAADCLDLEIKVRIILLKLFERRVMGEVGTLYQLANQLMIEAGILPELRAMQRASRRPGNPAAPIGQPSDTGPAPVVNIMDGAAAPADQGIPVLGGGQGHPDTHAGILSPDGSVAGGMGGPPGAGYGGGHGYGGGSGYGGGDASFGVMQQLLAGARRTGAPVASGGYILGPGGNYLQSSPAGGHPGYQGDPGGHYGADPATMGGGGSGGLSISTPELVSLLTQIQDSVDETEINPDEPVPLLDLRSMVFNEADSTLGEEAKGIEQNDEDVINIVGMLFDFILNDRNLAIPMKALISRLQIPFVKLAIIDKAFFEHSSHPARQLLNELSSAGIGWSSGSELKRDARYNKIESIVLRVLNGFTDNVELFQDLTDDLREFLKVEDKRHVQVEERVQQSETGKAKTQAVRGQVQQIINQKASGLRLPAQIGRFISDSFARALVMTGVRHGEDSGDWHMQLQVLDDLLWCCQPLAQEADMDQRDELLPQLLQRLVPIVDSIHDDPTAAEELRFNLECELQDAAARDRAFLGEEEASGEPELPSEYAPVAEIRLTEVTDDSEHQPQAAPQFLDKIRELNEGGWVELLQDGSDTPLRCKLSTVIQPGDRYVFVNRRGMKVADYGRMELARRLESKQLTLLDESEVFDRALQAVVGNLRSMQSRPSDGSSAKPAAGTGKPDRQD
jgi:hypothetical protein